MAQAGPDPGKGEWLLAPGVHSWPDRGLRWGLKGPSILQGWGWAGQLSPRLPCPEEVLCGF